MVVTLATFQSLMSALKTSAPENISCEKDKMLSHVCGHAAGVRAQCVGRHALHVRREGVETHVHICDLCHIPAADVGVESKRTSEHALRVGAAAVAQAHPGTQDMRKAMAEQRKGKTQYPSGGLDRCCSCSRVPLEAINTPGNRAPVTVRRSRDSHARRVV